MAKGRRLPEFLEPDEWEVLIKQPNRYAPTGLRNLCMVRLMGECGLRVKEVLGLKVRNVRNWMSGQIKVNGKGNKDRMLYVNEDTLELLRKWRDKRPESAGDLLFTTLKGGKLNDRYVRVMVKRYAKKAGIQKDVHPHTLRHTFATAFLRQTNDLRALQKMLGHEHLNTTQIYTHITDTEVMTLMRNFRIGGKR